MPGRWNRTARREGTSSQCKPLSWETTGLDIFLGWSDSIHPDYRGINLNDLFQHHAGLPPYTSAMSLDMRRLPAGRRVKELVRFILSRPPAKKPGSGGLYSNAGPAIAAVMAERVTGLSWETLIRNRLFARLRISGGFGWPRMSIRKGAPKAVTALAHHILTAVYQVLAEGAAV